MAFNVSSPVVVRSSNDLKRMIKTLVTRPEQLPGFFNMAVQIQNSLRSLFSTSTQLDKDGEKKVRNSERGVIRSRLTDSAEKSGETNRGCWDPQVQCRAFALCTIVQVRGRRRGQGL